MPSWVLALPFAVGCVASGVRFVAWVMNPFDRGSTLEVAAFPASSWLGYVMLVLSMILEWRHFGLRSRPARLWAYRLALIANAFMPIIYTLGFTRDYLGIPRAPAPPPLAVVLFPVYVAGFLFGLVSWAIVTFLCLSKDRSSNGPGHVLPAGFAVLGSTDHWLAGFLFLLFWT